MDSMKAWLTTKVKVVEQNATDIGQRLASNVMTPRTVPQFVIPHFHTADESDSDKSSVSPANSHMSIGSLCRSPTTRSCPVSPTPARTSSDKLAMLEPQRSFGSTDSFPNMVLNLGDKDAHRHTLEPSSSPQIHRHDSPSGSPLSSRGPFESCSSENLRKSSSAHSPTTEYSSASSSQLRPCVRYRLNMRSRSAGEPASLDLNPPPLRRQSPQHSPTCSPTSSPTPNKKSLEYSKSTHSRQGKVHNQISRSKSAHGSRPATHPERSHAPRSLSQTERPDIRTISHNEKAVQRGKTTSHSQSSYSQVKPRPIEIVTKQRSHSERPLPPDPKDRLYIRRRSSLTSYDEKLYLACKTVNKVNQNDSLDSRTPSEDELLSEASLSPASLCKSHSHMSGLSDVSSHSVSVQGRTDIGQVKLSMQYLPGSKQLKVHLLKGENLGGSNKSDSNVNSYVKLYLIPGKLQKRTSKVVKNNKHPSYNEDFHFLDLELESMPQMQLKVKVLNKSYHIIKPEVIGECQVKLDALELTSECRMWKSLKSKVATQDLGQIQLSMRLEPQADRLTITLIKAKDLPKSNLGHSPDPQVKISVVQRTKEQVKESRTRKKTTHPSWKEAFSFLIRADPENLQYYTAVTVTVHDHEKPATEDLIGQVRFGQGALQDSENNQWNKVLNNYRKEFTEWHRLMEADDERD